MIESISAVTLATSFASPHWRRIKPKARERLRVKLRHLCLGTRGRLDPRGLTLRKLHEWGFLLF